MIGRIFIKPATLPEGEPMKVRKPVNGHLALDGEWVNPESYWQRRLNDGDVVVAEPSAAPAPAPAPTVSERASKQAASSNA